MPADLPPGVYVQEILPQAQPIERVATSVAAFIGSAHKGPAGEPVLVHSWGDYVRNFGPISSNQDWMGLAVSAFFLNGGQDAYIARLVSANPPAAASTTSVAGQNTGADAVLTITASSVGKWGDDLYIRIKKDSATSLTFTLEVGHLENAKFVTDESFTGLVMNARSGDFALTRVNGLSRLVKLSLAPRADSKVVGNAYEQASLKGAAVLADAANVVPVITLGASGQGVPLAGGAEGALTSTEFKNFFTELKKVPDVSMIVLPGQSMPKNGLGNPVIAEALAHAEDTRSRMVIVDPAPDAVLDQATAVNRMRLPTSTFAVLYYPWVMVANPLHTPNTASTEPATLAVAPSAFAAGIWSKTDGRRGVWKAPAGAETALLGVSGLAQDVSEGVQDQVNVLGVNCIRNLPGIGPVIWGARTLATKAAPEWRYVPVRRTAIMIERSIYNGIQWAVFEPNTERLWASLRANIGAFMNGLFRAGAFQGEKPSDAYFVRCGLGDTMTQDDIDRGQVIVLVGFAPLKPSEFVIVRIQQILAQQ